MNNEPIPKHLQRTLLLAAGLLIVASGPVLAAKVTSLYGDVDGFGIGMPVGTTYSGYYPSLSKNDGPDFPTITDNYLEGDASWSLKYDLSGIKSIKSATLEFATYGQGWGGTSSLYFDDVFVGTLTDGDTSDPNGYLDTNASRRDVFNLSAFLDRLDGVNSIRIDTIDGWNGGDIWALDYSKLTVTGVAVPAPATLALLAAGLLLAARFRPRRAVQA